MSRNGGGRHPIIPDAALAQMAAQAPVINTQPEAPVRDLTKAPEPHPFDGIRMLGHWVLIEQVRTEEFSQSGLVVVPEAAQRPIWQVLAIGPQAKGGFEVGDIVMPAIGIPVHVFDGRTFATVIAGDGSPGLPAQLLAVLDKASWRNQPAKPAAPKLITEASS